MMMGYRPTTFHDLFSCSILNQTINLKGFRHSLVLEPKVNINSCPCIIDLSYSEANKRGLSYSQLTTIINHTLLDLQNN